MAVTKVTIQAALSGALDVSLPMYAAAAAAAVARAASPSEDAALLLAHRIAAGQQLGIEATDDKLMLLVDDMLKEESLPPSWTATFDTSSNPACWVYKHDLGLTQFEHPLIDYYRGAMFMDKGGYRLVLKSMRTYRPVLQEVLSMLAYFGITEEEDKYIQEVAKLALASPMPSGWEEERDPVTGQVMYRDTCSGLKVKKHPLDSYFRELRDRRRRDMEGLRWAAVRTMPRAKSSPLPPPPPPPSPPSSPTGAASLEAPTWSAKVKRMVLRCRSARIVSAPGATPSCASGEYRATEPLRRTPRGSISCSSIGSAAPAPPPFRLREESVPEVTTRRAPRSSASCSYIGGTPPVLPVTLGKLKPCGWSVEV